MAKVTNFIYCLNSNTSDVEANALGVLTALTPDYIPGAFSFSVLCSILDVDNGNHNVNMQFVNPAGKVIVDIQGIVPYDFNCANNLPKEYSGINISSNWQNVLLETSGLYKTIVRWDGEECGTFEIYVRGKNEAK